MSSTTRNNKRKRQQQPNDQEAGSIAAVSTSHRRSRDQRAQAASAKSPDPDQASPIVPEASSSGNTTATTSLTENSGSTMGNAASAQGEKDTTKQLTEQDDRKTSSKDTEAQQSPSKDTPPNGTLVHSHRTPINATTSRDMETQPTRSLRSSPDPFDDGGENSIQEEVDRQQRTPLHISTQLADEDRETRLQDLIAHRSLLLERVRACRSSAEKRLGETTFSSALPASTQNSGKEMTETEEIAAFREMTKKANQLLKRSRTDGDPDKRTSFSLRRGSAVGKKMNAALSSLAPGSSAASAAAALAVANPGMNAAPTIPGAAGINPSPPKAALGTTSTSNKFAGTTPIPKFPSNQQSAFNPSTNTRGPASKNPRTSAGAVSGAPPSLRRNDADPATYFMGGTSLSPAFQSPHRMPQQQQSQDPRVYFPEAVALREKRDNIQEKLRAILERQQQQQDHTQPICRVDSGDDDSRRFVTSSPGRGSILSPGNFSPGRNNIASQQHSQNKVHRRRCISGLEIQPPTPLPDRRRTHWDTVLQEMSWLAADFIQERQWKLSSARVLSSGIPKHRLLKHRSTPTLEMESSSSHHSATSDVNLKTSKTLMKGKAVRQSTNGDNITDLSDKPSRKTKPQNEPYKKPSYDDVVLSKSKAKIVSAMLYEASIAIQKGGAVEPTDKYRKEGLERFRNTQTELVRPASSSASESDKRASNCSDKMDVEHPIEAEREQQSEPTLESIAQRIEQLHKIGKSRHKAAAARDYANSLKSKKKINLHPMQKNMVDFVEKLWGGNPSPGAVLSGSVTTGKTYATATVLWKQSSNGPQLVVCPSTRMFRWKNELEQFSNTRVLMFGPTGGITSPTFDSGAQTLEGNDIAICDYGSLRDVKSFLIEKRISLYSIVVDFRHGLGLREYSDAEPEIPSHFVSSEWWDHLMSVLDKDSIRRLFVDYDSDDPLSLSRTRLQHRDQLVALAQWTACILGIDIFRSRSSSIQRQVISWARRTGKTETANKMERVKMCLRAAVDPLCFHAKEELVTLSDLQWDLRKCPMTAFQRKEYDRCCFEVRGALSSNLSKSATCASKLSETLWAAAGAIIRLRQYCFHPRSIELLRGWHSRNINDCLAGNFEKLPPTEVSPSQPDAKSAEILLHGSAKLNELVSIMVKEGGFSFDAEKSVECVVAKAMEGEEEYEGDSPKKMAIIASLPEIQLLIAFFLNAVGIRNVLLSGRSWSSARCHEKNNKQAQDVTWFRSQCALASIRVDGDKNCERQATVFSDVNVVIASPSSFGYDDGLGVEGAQMIVVVDTDWSGRDGVTLDDMVKRWLARNSLVDRDIELIRLVCDDSIEKNLFHEDGSTEDGVPWPLSKDGCFTFPHSEQQALELYKSALTMDRRGPFPATSIFRERGFVLSDVLEASSILPPTLGTGEVSTFLPRTSSDELELRYELQLVRQLITHENKLAYCGNILTGASTDLMSRQTAVGKSSLSVSKESWTTAVFARQDVIAVPTFEYLEHIAKSQSMIKIPGGDETIGLRSQLTEFSIMEHNSNEGLSKASVDTEPSSFLLYEPNNFASSKVSNCTDDRVSKRRFNCYATVFSGDGDGVSICDGNQGNEALVFFPPLFPLLEDSAKRARHNYYTNLSSFTRNEKEEILDIVGETHDHLSTKRKPEGSFSDERHAEKRPRVEIQATQENGILYSDDSSKITPPQLSKKSLETATIVQHPAQQNRNDLTISPIEEDFGLLGSGAIARPVDSASYSSYDSVRIGGFHASTDKFDFLSYPIPCDAEETRESSFHNSGKSMGDVILFVKNGSFNPQDSSHFQARPLSVQVASRNYGIVNNSAERSSYNGDDAAHRAKNKRSPSSTVAAFTRVTRPSDEFHSSLSHKRKDFRHKAFSSYQSRERNTGLSMFDTYLYRVSAMRVERRVTERLDQWLWKSTVSYDVGPGIPIGLKYESSFHVTGQRSWVNLAEALLPGSTTGDRAKALSKMQQSALRRSSVAPCRVDFGPFEAGFMASPSGMTALSSQRVRVGVSLPMGVKITQPQLDDKQSHLWRTADEKLLQDTVIKYGKNWLLVANTMNGIEHIVFSLPDDRVPGIRPIARSARECCDKWHDMVKARPRLAGEFEISERRCVEDLNLQDEDAKDVVVRSNNGTSIIVKSGLLNKDTTKTIVEGINETERINGDEKKSEEDSSPEDSEKCERDASGESTALEMVDVSPTASANDHQNNRFFLAAIIQAKTKKHVVPITIPGVVIGQPPNQPVPSHPSHIQAVQTSVTAQWAQGRTEMWPLQILDLADKQRQAARATAIQRVPNGPTPSSRHPQHGNGVPLSHGAPASRTPSSRSHPGHVPYPTVPPNAPRPVGLSRGGPPPSSTGSSPPQRMHPHHSRPHPHHRSPPVSSHAAPTYVPPPSATTATHSPTNTSASQKISSEVSKPLPAVQPTPTAQHSEQVTVSTPPAPTPTAMPAVPSKPEAASKSG
ncbi:helicase domain protein [Nitzschia inconspicua]|uniref:Helicase domain protein n=1 Tax=Nitzschia inconspicua TaxID=303405 RepID=A0A9K3Q6E9_9STRA|nr:helicase domain protein [Nitzschia inconspicua]